MIFVAILLLIAGFVALVKGADVFVDGAAALAGKFGIPQLVIGLTIVAMGTSMPEAAVSINSALKGNAGITIGNIVGSNILNILIILGITAVITTVAVQKSTIWIEIPYMLVITVLLLVLGKKRKSDYIQRRCYPLGGILVFIWDICFIVQKRIKKK